MHRYAMFYLPFDIGYKVFKFLPVKVACAAMKEVYRAKKVHVVNGRVGVLTRVTGLFLER